MPQTSSHTTEPASSSIDDFKALENKQTTNTMEHSNNYYNIQNYDMDDERIKVLTEVAKRSTEGKIFKDALEELNTELKKLGKGELDEREITVYKLAFMHGVFAGAAWATEHPEQPNIQSLLERAKNDGINGYQISQYAEIDQASISKYRRGILQNPRVDTYYSIVETIAELRARKNKN